MGVTLPGRWFVSMPSPLGGSTGVERRTTTVQQGTKTTMLDRSKLIQGTNTIFVGTKMIFLGNNTIVVGKETISLGTQAIGIGTKGVVPGTQTLDWGHGRGRKCRSLADAARSGAVASSLGASPARTTPSVRVQAERARAPRRGTGVGAAA